MAIEKGTNFALMLGTEITNAALTAWTNVGVITSTGMPDTGISLARLQATGDYPNLADSSLYYLHHTSATEATVRTGPGATDPVVNPGAGGTIDDVDIRRIPDSGGFTIVAGQENTEVTLGGETVDTTDKSQEGWESKLRATQMASCSASGFARWPDTVGINQLRTRYLNPPGFTIARIRERGTHANGAPGYDGLFMVEELNLSAGSKDVTRYSVSLGSVGKVYYRSAEIT